MNKRQSSSIAFVSSLAIIGCNTYSATLASSPDAGATGGIANAGSSATSDTTVAGNTASAGDTSNLGGSSATGGIGGSNATGGAPLTIGGSSALSGATSTGGAPSAGSSGLGGASTTGGASASNGSALPTGGVPPSTGGTTSAAGTSAPIGGSSATGGAQSTGGAPSSGGASPTGGASSCTKDADCINPDPINCTFTCVNPGATGVCKPAVTLTPTQCATTACDDRAISGFWDAAGKPHIAYGFTETDGSATIRMQQVKADGTADGAVVPYKLPALEIAPWLLSVAAQGNKIGLLWNGNYVPGTTAPTELDEFATTDLSGLNLSVVSMLDGSPAGTGARLLRLETSNAMWIGLRIADKYTGLFWDASFGSSLGSWGGLSKGMYDGGLASGIIGSTLMLTGSECKGISGCSRTFNLQRYSLGLVAVGSSILLSSSFQASSPAMGPVHGAMAILWTETQSPGQESVRISV